MFVAELCPPVGPFGWPSPSLRLPYRCIANKRLPPGPRSRNGSEVGGAELCLFSRFYERNAFDGVLSGTCAEGYSAPPLRSAQDRPQKRRGGRRRTKRGESGCFELKLCVAQARLLEDACGKLVCLGWTPCKETFPEGGRLATPAGEAHFALVPQGGVAEAVEEREA